MTPWLIPLPPWTANPGRLVQRDQRVIFEQDRRDGERRAGRLRPTPADLCDPDRRHPQPVAGVKPCLGPRPAAIEPDLAAAQDAIDVALGNPLQNLEQVVVDALAFTILPHREPVDRILA